MPSKKHSQNREVSNEKSTHPNIARQLKKETVAFIWRTLPTLAMRVWTGAIDPKRQSTSLCELPQS
jgi:hypothetical protein